MTEQTVLHAGENKGKMRAAQTIGIVLGVTYAVVAPVYIYLAWSNQVWQLYPLAITTFLLGILAAVTVHFSRRDQAERGMKLLLLGHILFYPLTPSLISGLGIFLGLALLIGGPIAVISTMTGRGSRRLLILTGLSGVVTLLLEIFGAPTRPLIPELITLIPGLVIVVLITLAVIMVRQFPHYSLRTKLMIAFVVASVLSLAVAAFFTGRATRTVLIDNANQKLFAAASQTGARIDTFVTTNLIAVETEAKLPALVQYLALDDYERRDSAVQSDLVAYLDALSQKNEAFISSYALLDNVGVSLIDTSMANINVSKANRPYFSQPLLTGRPYVSPVMYSPETGQPAIYFSAPVVNANGAVLGVLRVRYEASILQEMIADNTGLAGPDSFAVLFDEYALHLAHGTAPSVNHVATVPLSDQDRASLQAAGRLPAETEIPAALNLPNIAGGLERAAEEPFFSARDVAPDGSIAERLNQVAVVELETQPWRVAFFQPQDVFLAPIEAQTRNIALLAIVIAVVAVGVAVGISHLLVRPITELTNAAVRVAAGDLAVRAQTGSDDEIGTLARTFNGMTAQLRDLVGALEQRVADRTRDLALANEVGRRVAQVRDLDTLLPEAVELIRARFGLYYTQIYLTDATRRHLVLRAGTGVVGDQLVRRGHQLAITNDSINGRAAGEKRPVVVADTAISQIFRPNPMLPGIRSEMAVPLLVGERVVGVLDLQSDLPGMLTEENVPAFETLAGQLAVAIENAHLFTEISEARSELEAQTRRLTRAGWQEFLNGIEQREQIGYVYDQTTVAPFHGRLPELPEGSQNLDAPIPLAGEMIGTIRLEGDPDQPLTPEQVELVNDVARQVAQQVENLRLLNEADRYRLEAEAANRRLTGEGWAKFRSDQATDGYLYNGNQVLPLAEATADERKRPAVHQSLAVRGATIGELAVADTNALDDEARAIVAAVAGQLSIHVENLRLTEQTEQALTEAQRRNEELGVLNRIVSTVSTTLDLQQSLQTIATELAQVIGVEQVGIALLNDERTSLTVVAEHFDPEHSSSAIGFVIPVEGNELTQQVLATREPVVIYDAQHHPLTEPVHDGMRQRGVWGLIVLPIVAGEEVIGTVGLDLLEEDRTLSAEHLRLAETIVYQAAAAIQNARLFEQTQASLAETRALYQISAGFNSAESYDDILAVLQRHTRIGREAQTISLNYFDRPWTDTEQPEWVQTIAFWSELTNDVNLPRYQLADFPSAIQMLTADAPTIIDDVAHDPRVSEAERAMFVRYLQAASTIFVPFVVGGQWIGMMNATYGERVNFSAADVERLTTIAGQAAVAIQSIHLLESTNRLLRSEQRQRRIADILVHATERMTGLQRESEIFELIVDEIEQLLQPDQISLYLWQANENALEINIRKVAALGHDEDSYQAGQLVMAEERQDLWRVMAEGEPWLEALPQPGEYVREHYRIPLWIGDGPVGIVEIYHTARGVTIRPEDQASCEGLIQQAALRLQNVRLLQTTQQRATQLERLAEIETALSQAEGEQEILAALARYEHPEQSITLHYIREMDETGWPTAAHAVAHWAEGRLQPRASFLYHPYDIRNYPLAILALKAPDQVLFVEDVAEVALPEATGPLTEAARHARAVAILPLRTAGRWQGFLTLAYPTPHPFSEDEHFIWQQLLEPVAAVVAGRRAFLAQQEARHETENLYRASRRINESGGNLQDIVATVAEAGFAVSLNRATLFILEASELDETPIFTVAATWHNGSGTAPPALDSRLTEVTFPVLSRFLTRSPQFVADIQAETDLDERSLAQFRSRNTRAAAILPLWAGGHQLGVILLEGEEVQSFHDRDVQPYLSLLPQVAVAVENYQLLAQAQQRARREQMLREITARVRSSADVETIMKTAVQEVGRALGRKTFVYLAETAHETPTAGD